MPIEQGPERDKGSGDAAPRGAEGSALGNNSAEEASRRALEEVSQQTKQSFQRDGGDSAIDTSWTGKDQKSLDLASRTSEMSEQLQTYLQDPKHDFSDAEGRKLAGDFIKQLRLQREDHVQDRGDKDNGALQYAGTDGKHNPLGIPEAIRQPALTANQQMAQAAAKLLDPNTNPEERASLVKKISDNADSIRTGLDDGNPKAGKDQKDAIAESKAISANIAALSNPQVKLSAEQQTLLVKNILSKTGLIADQLGDVKNETDEANHDNQAIALGSRIETYLRYAMTHPGDAGNTLTQLGQAINDLHNPDGTGADDLVAKDRKLDAGLEGVYTDRNKADAELDQQILNFKDIYPGKS